MVRSVNSRLASLALFCALAHAAVALASQPILLEVDARHAPRRIIHSTLTIPAAPGPMTLVYPKWLPGEHGPSGPLPDAVGLRIRAGDRDLPWRRDLKEMFTVHLHVPEGADSIVVKMDYVETAGPGDRTYIATARLGVLEWNRMLLAPGGVPFDDLTYQLVLKLPAGWGAAGSLAQRGSRPADVPAHRIFVESTGQGGVARFAPVSLTRLIDTPILVGEHLRTIDLGQVNGVPHWLELGADSPAALEIDADRLEAYRRLVQQFGRMLRAHPYERYHFLLALSDYTRHGGLEHFDCSDNRLPERSLIDPERLSLGDSLLSHELFHVWCGKHRRPASLTAPDYQETISTDMLWVYEGLTDYYGNVLAARAGTWSHDNFRDNLAYTSAMLMGPGRNWRPLQDTADAAQVLDYSTMYWTSWRRSQDYYEEGVSLWMEADCLIRRETGGKRSLDDFARAFLADRPQPYELRTFSYEELLAALNAIHAHDWDAFFTSRLSGVGTRLPLDAIEAAGWRVVYRDQPNAWAATRAGLRSRSEYTFSLGFRLNSEGVVMDCWPGSPAHLAGIAPGLRLVAVNGRRWSTTVLDTALREARESKQPIRLLTENLDFFEEHSVEYYDGPRHPHLERDDSRPDLLGDIIRPLES